MSNRSHGPEPQGRGKSAMAIPKPPIRVTMTERCQFLFGTAGARCQAVRSHPIHHGVDDGPDRAHEFVQ